MHNDVPAHYRQPPIWFLLGLLLLPWIGQTLPYGHVDPCRAFMSAMLVEMPRPAISDGLGLGLMSTFEQGLYNRVAQEGPFRCLYALTEHHLGRDVTALR